MTPFFKPHRISAESFNPVTSLFAPPPKPHRNKENPPPTHPKQEEKTPSSQVNHPTPSYLRAKLRVPGFIVVQNASSLDGHSFGISWNSAGVRCRFDSKKRREEKEREGGRWVSYGTMERRQKERERE
jgi:hypothetical protein